MLTHSGSKFYPNLGQNISADCGEGGGISPFLQRSIEKDLDGSGSSFPDTAKQLPSSARSSGRRCRRCARRRPAWRTSGGPRWRRWSSGTGRYKADIRIRILSRFSYIGGIYGKSNSDMEDTHVPRHFRNQIHVYTPSHSRLQLGAQTQSFPHHLSDTPPAKKGYQISGHTEITHTTRIFNATCF